MRSRIPTLLVLALLAGATLAAKTKFTSTWAAPGTVPGSFAGKKVAALVISTDESLRVSGEEALARELVSRGVDGVAAYRVIPKEILRDTDKAKEWFERAGFVGLVSMRPVSAEKERTWQPSMWTTAPYYSTLWGYYGYGWGAVYDPGYVREDTILTIETMVYSVPANKLLWAGMSETTNPKAAGKVIEDLVEAVVKDMKKQGLVQK
jgi:hypothetical protein